MDAVRTFKSGLLEFDITQSICGRYAGMESSRVSRAMTEEIPFTAAEAQAVTETIAAMRSVQAEMPLPINWSLIGKVKPVVDQRRTELREQIDPIIHRCTLVRISATNFFQRVNGTNVVTTPSELVAAAFEHPALAEEVVLQLKKFGTNSRIEVFGAFRHKSTMSHSLVELGFEPAAIGGQDDQSIEG